LQALGVKDERELTDFVERAFPKAFAEWGKQIAIAQLEANRKAAEKDRDRYKQQQGSTGDRVALRLAAIDLDTRAKEIAAIWGSRSTTLPPGGADPNDPGVREFADVQPSSARRSSRRPSRTPCGSSMGPRRRSPPRSARSTQAGPRYPDRPQAVARRAKHVSPGERGGPPEGHHEGAGQTARPRRRQQRLRGQLPPYATNASNMITAPATGTTNSPQAHPISASRSRVRTHPATHPASTIT
jgi:hypothetical protein